MVGAWGRGELELPAIEGRAATEVESPGEWYLERAGEELAIAGHCRRQ